MKTLLHILLAWSVFLTARGLAQTVDLVEESINDLATEKDQKELLERLQWLQEHPYNLNVVTVSELESIPGFSPSEAGAILRLRDSIGGFTSLEQVRQIPELSRRTTDRVFMFTRVLKSENNAEQHLAAEIRARTIAESPLSRGYLDGSFLGSPVKSYLRVGSTGLGVVNVGGLFEKDSGERLANGFRSGFVEARLPGIVSQVLAGDFVIEAGQGLVFWRGSYHSGGNEPFGRMKQSTAGVIPYRSTDEFNFFRGLALSSQFSTIVGKMSLTLFLSSRRYSAGADDNGAITGFDETGMLKTESELKKRDRVGESLLGGRLILSYGKEWTLGASAYRSSFDRPIVGDLQAGVATTGGSVIGIDAEYNSGRLTCFGELAGSHNGAVSGVGGFGIDLGRKGSILFLYHSYSPRFRNLHANGFGEHDDTNNERGLDAALQLSPFKWITVNTSLNHYYFPSGTYFIPLSSSGWNLIVRADLSLNRQTDLSSQFTTNIHEERSSVLDLFGREDRTTVDREDRHIRITATYLAGRSLRLKIRVERSDLPPARVNAGETGLLLYQDVQVKTIIPGMTIEARLVLFQTDSYDSRIYEYENDLRGVFTNPALFGKGRRWYILAGYKIGQTLTLSLKYSQTRKEGVTSLGAGPDEIAGDQETNIAAQIDLGL